MTGADIYSRAVEYAQLRAVLLGMAARYSADGMTGNARNLRKRAFDCEATIRELALKAEIQLARQAVIAAEREADQQAAAGVSA